MPTFNAKCAAVAKVFGEVDRDDPEYVDFLYARRRCATVRERGRLDLKYVAEIDALEQAIWQTLALIRDRDGEKIFKESASYVRQAVDTATSARRPRARTKANKAAAHA